MSDREELARELDEAFEQCLYSTEGGQLRGNAEERLRKLLWNNKAGIIAYLRLPTNAQAAPDDQRASEDMTLAHNARKTAIEEYNRDAQSGQVPGFRLVPYKPTQEMLDAVTSSEGHEPWTDKTMTSVYQEMLDEYERTASPPSSTDSGDVA